jgi:hypothetical protein
MRVEQLTGQPTTAVISDTLCRLATGEWSKVVEKTVSLREAHCYLKIWRALWKVSAAMRP